MKRFFLLLLSLWKEQLKLYFVAALIGAIIGVLVLAPSYDYINSQTITDNTTSSIDYMSGQFKELLKGNVFQNSLMLFYAEIGAMLGLLTIGIYILSTAKINNRYIHVGTNLSSIGGD